MACASNDLPSWIPVPQHVVLAAHNGVMNLVGGQKKNKTESIQLYFEEALHVGALLTTCRGKHQMEHFVPFPKHHFLTPFGPSWCAIQLFLRSAESSSSTRSSPGAAPVSARVYNQHNIQLRSTVIYMHYNVSAYAMWTQTQRDFA